ncbi:hypothetical protein [Lutibacter sp.]|uniref:hypothetical protein n=1 Tax=Lutibacter sp. TaxID=1925666 RepID=UPI0034A085D5
MNTKAQLGQVVYIMIVIIVSGFILAWLSPLIDSSKETALDSAPSDSIFGRLILVGLGPIMWFMFILLSLIILVMTMVSGGAFG